MRSDSEIKRDVENELRWDPDLDPSDIAIVVTNGVVTLNGFVRSRRQVRQAEAAAKRIAGVLGVANDIEVRWPIIHARPDPEIARDVVDQIQSLLPNSWQQIRVVVEKGWVTLEGSVEWYHERERAEGAALGVRGVKGVTNLIQLQPRIQPSDLKEQIKEAFRRSAQIDANHVAVEVSGSEVILKGTVRSWAEREEAERTTWRAPGVTKVDNRIVVQA
jgi:osmotically-inducible protein OsmY